MHGVLQPQRGVLACRAKVKQGGEVTARPLRNLLLMSLKRVKVSSISGDGN